MSSSAVSDNRIPAWIMIIYFLHIPKTAGTAFTRYVDQFFAPNRILKPQTWNQYFDQTPVDTGTVGLVRGHFGLGAQYLFPEPLVNMTLLRDPVERTLSQYNHLKIDRKYNNWAPENIPLPPLAEALEHPFWTRFFSNVQARYLGLDLNPLPHLRPGFLFDSWDEFMRPRASDQEIFATAYRQLLEFACVGTQERLDDTVRLLATRFGWQYEAPKPAMILPGRLATNALDPAVRRRIRELNTMDLELHKIATQLVESQIEETCAEVAA